MEKGKKTQQTLATGLGKWLLEPREECSPDQLTMQVGSRHEKPV